MAERPRLDAVLFDAGGTLVRIDYEWMAETVSALGHPLDAAALRRGEIEGRRRYDASAGRPLEPGEEHPTLGSSGDIRAYFAGMLESARVPEALHDPVATALEERQAEPIGLWSRTAEGAPQALERLLALGLRLAVVSNSDGRAEAHLVHAGVRDAVEFVVDSQIVGIEKPDPGIFRIALERMAVAPERALYVGDLRSVDERGARAAGMHAVILDPFGDYVPGDRPSIASIGDLPAWVESRFDVPNGAARTAGGPHDGDPTR